MSNTKQFTYNVSDYDQFSYDYSQYWKKRRYEDLAEKTLLDKIFEEKRGDWFLDVGGSYGRLTNSYYSKYQHPVILDYSAKTLRNNWEIIKNKYPNTELIAANAYKMPFKENVFDGALMVRVLHHIEHPESYYKELRRILTNDAEYVQEFANKVHIKAMVRALLKGNFKFFSTEPYAQPALTMAEGSDNVEGIFYNFHPKHVKKLLMEQGFTIKKKRGCSFLRSPFLKKLFNDDTLLFLEKIARSIFSWTNIPPSVVFDTILKKEDKRKEKYEKIEDILCCPQCKGNLEIEQDSASCSKKCNITFEKKDNVWDFRVQ
ncbi:class I SAM-dependent methyltransferase [Candidatus Dojkabacteria bacterium]|jgi:ubiquinone/menaquinone biosynthesis C-methylase UbiE|nr:class I SAM-dependent methyltransferase [Candidatus Dojkabacteria bacterium]